MPRSANQKLKLLCLCKILWERTDEEHPLTVPELIQALEAWDIRAERKSIYDDMEALRAFGLDVQNRKGKAPGWFLGERPFQLAELKLLVDAVQSSKFITQRKSRELIRKLESQASVHQARQLQRQVYVDRRVKSMNESVYYTIDKLHTAIANRKAVTFKYFEYNVQKEKVFRREGKRYIVSPLGLIWDNENYYLAGYDHHREELRHYRVDKMAELAVNPKDQTVFISHGDCIEEAEYLAELVKERFPGHEIRINYIGPVIGTHAGAGTLALFFKGKHR